MDMFSNLQCKVEIKNEPHIDECFKILNQKKSKVISCTDLRLKLEKNRKQKQKLPADIGIKKEPLDDSYEATTVTQKPKTKLVVEKSNNVSKGQDICPMVLLEREHPTLENILNEDELLGDTDTMSVFTDCLDEDELLNEEEDEENINETNFPDDRISPKNKNENKSVKQIQSPTEKCFNDNDIFDTMSITATENEFNEEFSVEKAPKKRTARDLNDGTLKRSQSAVDKVSAWQQNQFKIPKLADNAKNILDSKTHKSNFQKPTPYRGLLSTPSIAPSSRISHKVSNEEKDLRSVISKSKERGPCFQYMRKGSCSQENCKFVHDHRNQKESQRTVMRLHERPPPIISDFRNHQNSIGLRDNKQIFTNHNSLPQIISPQLQLGVHVIRPPSQITNTRHSFPPTDFSAPSKSVVRLSFIKDSNILPSKATLPIYEKQMDYQSSALKGTDDLLRSNHTKLNLQTGTHFNIAQTSTRRETPLSYSKPSHSQEFRNHSLTELLDAFDETNDIETKWTITQRLVKSSSRPHHDCLVTLEKFLLLLRDDKSSRSLEIAREIFAIKRQMNCLKPEDFYILAELECKENNINKAMEYLTEYKTRFGEIEGIKADKEELLFYSIEPSAKITRFWEDFRTTALQSDRVLDRMLCTFSETKLTELFLAEDINMIYQKMMLHSSIKLSPPAKTTILYLLSTTENISQMIDYIDKHSDSILQITHPTALKILELIPNLPNIIDCLPVLRKLIKLVDPNLWNNGSSQKMWNLVLSYVYRKDLIQFSEQIYGIMEEVKVRPNIECSMMMLSGLCKNRFFPIFERRCHDLYKMKVFPEGYKFPTNFAQEISEALQKYHGEDKNIVHHMIRFLISSDCPPTENNITDVLNMLISKRRFSDVYSLIVQCFGANIILSQRDLRRAIFALEEWMQNVEASIHIYKNMRKFYPRPEHQCICGSHAKPQLQHPIRYLSTGELASPKSSNDSNQESSSDHTDSSRNTANHFLSIISAELNAFSTDIAKFTETYEQAYNNNYGDHDKVLVGLFLGLTETNKPDGFQQFVVQLFTKFGNVPLDVEKALGRVGLRLIKTFYERSLWEEAVEIIEVFHSYSIRYANAIEGFGTQIQTKEDLTSCEIADLCCRCCIYAKKPFTADAVFSHCDHCIAKDGLTNNQNTILEYLVSDLISYLLISECPDKTVFILTSTHKILKNDNLKELINKVLESLVNYRNRAPSEIAKDIETLSSIFENKNNFLHPKTTKALVYFYVTYNQLTNAKKYFDEGRKNGVYTETFFETQPFLAEIKTGMTGGEIFLTIESHLIRLINHPVFCISKQLKQPVDLVIAPGSDLDAEQFQFVVQQTMRELGRVLSKEFAPPLQILETENQKYVICPCSISEWYAQRAERRSQGDTDRYLDYKSNKRSVDIQTGSKGDMKIKFCPTPAPSDQRSIVDSESEISVVNTSIDNGEKRLLKSFPLTNNPIEAGKYIRKIVCVHLNCKYLKHGFLTKEDFKITAKELSEAFMDDLKNDKGYVYYDKHVQYRIQDYIDCFFERENNVNITEDIRSEAATEETTIDY